jgi:hypothetical protein
LHATGEKKRIGTYDEAVGAMVCKGREGSINLVAITRVQNLNLQPERVSSRRPIAPRKSGCRYTSEHFAMLRPPSCNSRC